MNHPLLAAALGQISSEGADAFYTGSIARGIVDEVTKISPVLLIILTQC